MMRVLLALGFTQVIVADAGMPSRSRVLWVDGYWTVSGI